jgi:hypothetical protein
MNKMIKLIPCLLILFWGFGCKTDNPKSVIFPLTAWNGPDSTLLTRETFQDIKDCGFTLNFSGYLKREHNIEALELADSVGLKLIIWDERIQSFLLGQDSTLAAMDSVVSDYSEFSSFWGYFISENPNRDDFERVAVLVRALQERDPGHRTYVKLLSADSSPEELGAVDYNSYISQYLELVKPDILNFFDVPTFKSPVKYYQSLKIIRTKSIQKNVPFWAFVFAANTSEYAYPNLGYLRFVLYSSFIYGAKGIQYYTYYEPDENHSDISSVLIDSEGNPTSLYTKMQKLNTRVEQVGEILYPLKSVGVFHSDPVPAGAQPFKPTLPIYHIRGDSIVVGFFTGKKKTYALLLNKNYERGTFIDVFFSQNVSRVVQLSENDRTRSDLMLFEDSGEKYCSLLLKAGEGRLLRLY